ncbi:CHAT domain-containing protein/tetratricopeptide (TPR) repeat protein [Paucibacter oligotrophus]|uniref:CHAT domain-containing protein/tetratricopeptide (TPR) repeat protein n=1 Tax=Roseateles oligotrophus TaxID=1769250 RepID=A0A840LG33_9BURK|nr:CHAT domain-containing tetratricopeptide repeat protein [Roseateles oligotrophus]MBB4845995.1 CHAT domain-containing protein/tetratricopeptide (TPR) repeat protein [Roseateles oligotrophus]
MRKTILSALLGLAAVHAWGGAMAVQDSASDSPALLEVNALLDEGRPDAALQRLEPALSEARRQWGERDPRSLELLSLMGTTLSELGRYADSLALRQQLLPLRRELHGEEDQRTLTDMSNLSVALLYNARFREAKQLGQQALALQERVLGPQHELTLMTLQNLAACLSRLAEWDAAGRLFERAMQAQQQSLGLRHADTLTMMANYGTALAETGRLDEALSLAQQTLALRRETLGEGHSDTAMSVHNYGAILMRLGRFEEARQAYAAAVLAVTAALGPEHALTLRLRSGLAYSLLALGQAEQAQAGLQQDLALFERSGTAEQAYGLRARQLLGAAQGQLGQWPAARATLQQAVQGFEQLGVRGGGDVVAARYGLAQAQAALGERPAAVQTLQALVESLEQQRGEVAEMSAAQRREWLQLHATVYHRLMDLLLAQGRPQQAFELMELSKARVLLEQMAQGQAAAQAGLPTEDAQGLRQLQQDLALAEAARARAQNPPARQAAQAQAQQHSRELRQLQSRLAAQHPAYALLSRPPQAQAAEAAGLLRPGEVFLSFLLDAEQRVRAFTLDSAARLRWHDLGPQPRLAEQVALYRSLLAGEGGSQRLLRWQEAGQWRWRRPGAAQPCGEAGPSQAAAQVPMLLLPPAPAAEADCQPAGATSVGAPQAVQALGQQLAQALLQPLQASLPAGTRLLIAPDGPLWLLPWDSLPWRGRPLGQSLATQQVHSFAALKMVRQRQAQRLGEQAAERQLLAFGDPSYPQSDEAQAADGAQRSRSGLLRSARNLQEAGQALARSAWPRLPFARYEMEQVAALFPPAQVLQISADGATETRLRQLSDSGELARFRYLLFSAHGYFDPEQPEFSSLVLKPDGEDVLHDGFVSVAEWLPLRLASELVVLSACDTARGRVVNGEGLVGMSYALFVAGNGNTLATLWPVADRETALFVTRFFKHLRQGLSQAQALALSKREFMRHGQARLRDPRVWAAFVLHGA